MLVLAIGLMAIGIPGAFMGHRLNNWVMKRIGGGLAALGILMFGIWAIYGVYDTYFRYG